MNAASAKPLDLPTRLDCRFEELSRQDLKVIMSQRGLKKRTHKILKFVQTVDQKKTFRYQIITLAAEADARRPAVHSPHKSAFDFTFDRSKSLHSTEQKKHADFSFDQRAEASPDLRRLPSLLGYGQARQEASKRHLTSTKVHKSRIAKSVTQMKIARTPNFANVAQTDQRSLFAARHIVDISGAEAGEQHRPHSTSSLSKTSRKTISPPAPKSLKQQSLDAVKEETLGLIPELLDAPRDADSQDKSDWLSDAKDPEQSSEDLRRALQAEPGLCPETLDFVRSTVESISRVFAVDQTAVIELWLKCESPRLVVRKLAMDLALN